MIHFDLEECLIPPLFDFPGSGEGYSNGHGDGYGDGEPDDDMVTTTESFYYGIPNFYGTGVDWYVWSAFGIVDGDGSIWDCVRPTKS